LPFSKIAVAMSKRHVKVLYRSDNQRGADVSASVRSDLKLRSLSIGQLRRIAKNISCQARKNGVTRWNEDEPDGKRLTGCSSQQIRICSRARARFERRAREGKSRERNSLKVREAKKRGTTVERVSRVSRIRTNRASD